MAGEFRVQIQEVRRFNRLSEKYRDIALFKSVECAEHAMRIVTNFVALEIRKYLQKDVKKPADQIYEGSLLASAVGTVTRTGATFVGEIVFPQDYAKYIERGRAPGEGLETPELRKAERERLVEWAKRKKPGEDPRQVAGRVLGKLLKKGTNKSNSSVGFIQPILDRFETRIPKMIRKEFLNCLDKELARIKDVL